MKYTHYKKDVLKTAVRLVENGLLIGAGGNVSVRMGPKEAIAITPSSLDYLEMRADDVCIVGFDGRIIEGERRPSVETGMHLALYKARPDAGGIVHTHQVKAGTFSVVEQSMSVLTDEQAFRLGDAIAVVPYAQSGSEELAFQTAKAAANRCNAFILKNHGVLTLGRDLGEACRNAQLLEKTAAVHLAALAAGLKVKPLPRKSVRLFFDLLKENQDKAQGK